MSPLPARWRNFLFDYDGTLVDSSALHAEAYRAALAELRPDRLPSFDYDRLKGLTTAAGFRSLGIEDEATIVRLTTLKQALFRQAIAAGRLAALPGAPALLAALRHAGRRLFLVSSGSAASVRQGLAHCGMAEAFAGVITGDDVARGKPAPDGYRLCLSRFGLDPDQSVAIEDAASGLAAARAAGLRVILVHDPALAGEADLAFPDLAALQRWATAPETVTAVAR